MIDNPVRRHVIETLFREARGRKTEQLDREFLQSIGALRTDLSPAKLPESPRLSAKSEAFHPRGFPRSASAPALPVASSPAEASPVDETPAVRTPQEQLSAFRGELADLAKLKKNMRASVKHNKIIINSYDERIRQHRDIFSAAESSGRFLVYRIPVDPLFRKAQEAGRVPQLYKVRGRGMKAATQQAIMDLDSSIWR